MNKSNKGRKDAKEGGGRKEGGGLIVFLLGEIRVKQRTGLLGEIRVKQRTFDSSSQLFSFSFSLAVGPSRKESRGPNGERKTKN